MVDPFLGEIAIVPYTYAPRNWAFCAGQVLPITENSALFSLLSTNFGGDGRVTFGIPDLRGRVPVGSLTMGNGIGGIYTPRLGELAGASYITLTVTQMPEHTHTAQVTGTETDLTVKQPAIDANGNTEHPGEANVPAIGTIPQGMGVQQVKGYNSGEPNTFLPECVVTGNVSVAVTNSTAGNSQYHSNMQPYLGLNYVIALQGVFPSRN